jgi:APA family basic amino acid/polyamine antiporter
MGDEPADAEAARSVAEATENIEGEAPVIEPAEEAEEKTILDDDVELERSISLIGGLAIGIGTMIGAGIFVFPGLAAEQVGASGALSFAIGAFIALLVALPTSELATAMPRSGGGYYFISRALGTRFGAIVGLGLWVGLVFATAFYLVGLGHYAAGVLSEVGIKIAINPVIPMGLLFGIALTALSMTGTENTAALQNYIVGLLLVILAIFLGFGGLDAAGIVGEQTTPERFDWGPLPLLSTAALLFTSYLGFAQVATVAGEIREPGKNLPRAMVGSVLIVGGLYVITMFVSTSVVGSATLEAAGETAMVEVGRELFGLPGAVAILFAGLLATISSANASILSASRAIYALSKDALLPRKASDINLKYGTPHIALGMAGVPILILTASGQVELLAEVASFLHLVMYGLICFALIALRRNPPEWYDPDYITPGYPVLPAIGGIASFGLIIFMAPLSIAVGVVIMVLSLAWHAYYASDVKLKNAL